jgi:thioredoxin-related protein
MALANRGTKLDTAANIAVLLLAGIVGIQLTIRQINGRRVTGIDSQSDFKPGDRIADNTSLALAAAPYTLLLFNRSGCKFCTDSLPFYQKLAVVARQSGVRLVSITSEDLDSNRAYLNANQVPVERVIAAQESHLRARGTPTLLLVARTGAVIDSWSGKLASQAELRVLDSLQKAVTSTKTVQPSF